MSYHEDGTPPYVVRWEADGHEGLVFPGPDCHIEAAARLKTAKKPASKKPKK